MAARIPLIQRFWAKVDFEGPVLNPILGRCWQWKGYISPDRGRGYGIIHVGGRSNEKLLVHRYVFSLLPGGREAMEGKTIDHLCRNRGCVNPLHLQAVPMRENTLRGFGPSAENARKTHCKRGHEFTPENTYLHDGRRICKQCNRDRNREFGKAVRAKRRLHYVSNH